MGVLRRFKEVPDTESEQALLRLAICFLAGSYLYWTGALSDFSNPWTELHRLAVVSNLVYGFIPLFWIYLNPRKSIWRRGVCLAGDAFFISYALFACDASGPPFAFLYIWITSGYGVRFGLRYLFISQALCLIGMSVVIAVTPYWAERPVISAFTVLCLITVPLYVASLIARLTAMVRVAETANRAKSDFLANMSHELRTPLHGIMGFLDLLSRTRLERDQDRYVRCGQEAGRTLTTLIDNLLDFAQIEAGRVHIKKEEFDLYRLVLDTIAVFYVHTQSKDVRLRYSLDPSLPISIYADPTRLKQLLVNFVGNALKFTERGEVRLSLRRASDKEGRDCLELVVEDTGRGIEAAFQSQMFESFTQEDTSNTRTTEGLGLGAAISKGIVDSLDGSIEVESTPGRGTRLTVSLPLASGRFAQTPWLLPQVRRCLGEARPLAVGLDERLVVDIGRRLSCALPLAVRSTSIAEARALLAARAATIPVLLCSAAALAELQPPHAILIAHEAKRPSARDGVDRLDCIARLSEGFSTAELVRSLYADACDRFAARLRSPPLILSATRHVLLAEDNQISQKATDSMLTHLGHTVDLADDGSEALGRLLAHEYDVAVLDLRMPRKDGLEVIRDYRAQRPGSMLSFLILTASVTEAVKQTCEEVGVWCLEKPLAVADLAEAIDKLTPAPRNAAL